MFYSRTKYLQLSSKDISVQIHTENLQLQYKYKQTFVFFNSATWTVLPQKVRMSAVQQVSLLVLVKLEYFISLLLTVYVEQLLS